MKTFKITLLAMCLIFPLILKAQSDVIEKLGHNFKIVTLSNGKYEEFHDNDTIVEIGSALFNTKTGKIIGIKSNLSEALENDPEIISRWMCIDPLAEEYHSWTPYNYVANNPLNAVDPDGREIKFLYEYEKDKDGNDIVDKDGNKNLIGVTMQITGKVINVSDNNVDMDAATADIASHLESVYQGESSGVTFKTEANLTVAESMDDVADSDHVFALAEMSNGGMDGTVAGAVNDMGGKVAFVDADYFTGVWDKNVGNTGERVAGHEMGHLLNLPHISKYFNSLHKSGGNRFFSMSTGVNNNQLSRILGSYQNGYLNKGSNYELVPVNTSSGMRYVKMPNRGRVSKFVKY